MASSWFFLFTQLSSFLSILRRNFIRMPISYTSRNITYPKIHDLNNNLTHFCNLSKCMWITNILPSAEHSSITLQRSAGTYILIYRPSLLSRNQCHSFPPWEIHISNTVFFPIQLTFPHATYIVSIAHLPFIIIVKPKFSKDFQRSAT